VFANESELKSLYETADFDTAVAALRGDARLAVVTRSEKGCVIVSKAGTVAVPAAPIKTLVDATGAGDLFAAGFLFGLARVRDHRSPSAGTGIPMAAAGLRAARGRHRARRRGRGAGRGQHDRSLDQRQILAAQPDRCRRSPCLAGQRGAARQRSGDAQGWNR